MHNSNVFYLINGEHHDLSNCYYCESCNKLITQEEVKIEIDTYFCPSCLENIPSSEAFSRNFRCINCFDCPKCMAAISANKLDLGSDSNENNERLEQYSYNCGFCHFSLDANNGLNFASDTNDTIDKDYRDENDKLALRKESDSFSMQLSNYLSLIVKKISNSNYNLDKNTLSDTIQIDSINVGESDLRPALRVLEEKQKLSSNILKEKNLWLSNNEIKCFSNIKNSFPFCQQKNNLSYRQYLNNPDIINSVYLSFRTDSNIPIILYPFKKKLCVQISKRCISCRRLVIKPQLNPLSQPPFRVNLSANLFLPNFRIVKIEDNTTENRSYTKIIRIRIENLMDKQVRVDFLPENGQNEQLSMGSSRLYSIVQLEPKSFNIEPKWDPLLEQQDQQSIGLVHEKRSRNKKYLDVSICESDGIRESLELELSAFVNFQSPTGNESTIQIKIIGKLNTDSESYTIN